MSVNFGVVWPLPPHTAAKHEILRLYLGAWFPILGTGTSRDLLYLDGFAGPGEYSGGERGSPLIALDAALPVASSLRGTARFVFSELDDARASHLQEVLDRRSYPENFRLEVFPGRPFEEVVSQFLDELETSRSAMPALFVFIDPFGWTGFPMDLVRRILQLPRAEVFINFMYADINRFVSLDEQSSNFDSLFGCAEWE